MIRPELRQTFIEEVDAYLTDIGRLLSQKEPRRLEAQFFPTIRDHVHNLKGVASMVGAESMARAAEMGLSLLTELERRSDAARDVVEEEFGPILHALIEMIEAVRSDHPEACDYILNRLVLDVKMPAAEGGAGLLNLPTELREMFLSEASECLDAMQSALISLANSPESAMATVKLFHGVMNLKGSAGMVDQSELIEVLSFMNAVLEEIEEKGRRPTQTELEVLGDSISFVESLIEALRLGSGGAADILSEFRRIVPQKYQQGTEAIESSLFSEEQYRDALRAAFQEEGAEHLAQIRELIVLYEKNGASEDLLHRLFRVVHTLKGAAATIGLHELARSAHTLEDLLERLQESGESPGSEFLQILYEAERSFRLMMASSGGKENDAARHEVRFAEQLTRLGQGSGADAPMIGVMEPEALPEAPEEETLDVAKVSTIRVPMNRLDLLLNLVSEMSSNHARTDELLQSLHSLFKKIRWERRNLGRLLAAFQRQKKTPAPLVPGSGFSSGFAPLEFDSYSEISLFLKNLEELEFKIGGLFKTAESLTSKLSEDSTSFSGLLKTIQGEMSRVRLIPMETLFHGLDYQARILARVLGKRTRVEFSGGHTEIDKGVIDGVADPLMHLLRNCLDHGIEMPEVREKIGKSVEGLIRIGAVAEERNVVLTVEDDGAGIDTEHLCAAAVEQGLLSREELAEKSLSERIELIFYPQLSTRAKAGDISGRGIGMDAVRHALAEMYGSIQVESERGKGTRFTLKLPLTLAMQPILIVLAEPHFFCLPMSYVETILEPGMAEIEHGESPDRGFTRYHGERLPVRWLASFFRIAHDRQMEGHPIVVLRNGDRRMALVVDEVTGSREAIVRPLSPLLSAYDHFLGTTITARGHVVLVLNVPFLFGQHSRQSTSSGAQKGSEPLERLKILIADDSLSVRQTLKFMLEKHGVKTATAKDGLLAWHMLRSFLPDLLILDLEMPNLNGYELITRIRRSSDLADLPILILTSRGGQKHRMKAMEAGADGFMSKPVLERKLLTEIRGVLPSGLQLIMDELDPKR